MVDTAPSPAMMPEIGPTLALEVDRPEWGYWKNEFRFGADVQQPGVAGERGIIWIPPVQGYVIVITNISVRGTTTNVDLGWRTGLPLLVWTEQRFVPLENRGPSVLARYLFGTNTSAASPFDSTPGAPATPNVFGRITATAGQGYFDVPIVLRAHYQTAFRGIQIRSSVDNTACNIVIQGYARPELPSERLG